MAASVSARPPAPKSMPWLLAIVTTSTPAAASASNACGGAWNVKRFGSGLPPVPIDVSRLTTVRSAEDSCGAIGAKAVAGSSRRARSWLSKWTSPANAIVIGPNGAGSGLAVGRGLVATVDRVATLLGVGPASGAADAPHADAVTTATTATRPRRTGMKSSVRPCGRSTWFDRVVHALVKV